MSRNGTMTSDISTSAFQQQQQQLAQLQNLENNYNAYQQARSLTSTDRRALNDVQHMNSMGSMQSNPMARVPQQPPQQQALQQQQQQPQQQPQPQPHQPPNPLHQQMASRAISTQDALQAQQQQRHSIVPSTSQRSESLRNPLYVSVPPNGNPTEVLAARFTAWRSLVGSLVAYLKEVASIQDEIVRQQVRLSHAVNFSLFASQNSTSSAQPSNRDSKKAQRASSSHTELARRSEETYQPHFFVPQGNGSVQDLPQILLNFHASSAALAQRASKDLTGHVIPRLEELRKDLLLKVKEIKSLSTDFKNSVQKELAQTKTDLHAYQKSVDEAKFNPQNMNPKNDPYLTKIILDRQIKKQLKEENYLHEAYDNLQSSGKELEKVVVLEVQTALTVYAKLVGEQAQNVFDKLISNLDYGFLTKPPSFEWDNFVAKDKNFIDENLPMRDIKSIQYDKINDPLAYEVRSSWLERRSKYLKSYSKAWYVLTPSFFHEFKSQDRKRDLIPVMSLSLDEIELEEHSRQDSSQYRFVLKKGGKVSSHKYMFRAESYAEMMAWYNDIKNLKALSSPTSRGIYASKHHSPLTRTSTKSSSNNIARTSTANDSVLTGVNNMINNSSNTNYTPMSQPTLSSDMVYVKQLGANESTPQSNRQSMPPATGYFPQQQLQPTAQQYQRYSLQFNPQQQMYSQSPQQSYRLSQQMAPYPVQQPVLDAQYSQQQFDQLQRTGPQVYVEAPTPMVGSSSTPKQLNPRASIDSYANRTTQTGVEPDGSGFSEETVKTGGKELDDDELENGKSTHFQ